jgi:hypothetical protein
MTARRVAIVMSDVYRLATGNALRPEDAVVYIRDPKAFREVVEASGVLDDAPKRSAIEKLIEGEVSDGV